MTLEELRQWHISKAKRHAVLAANVKAATAGEAHRKRNELQRQAEFHSDAVYAIDAALTPRVRAVEVPNCDGCGKAMPGYEMPGPAGELYCAACRGADGVPLPDGGPLWRFPR